MLEPLKHVLAKYTDIDCEDVIKQHYIVWAKLNLNLFCDFHTLLTLFLFVAIIGGNYALIKFVQGKYVFICNFVIMVKICEANLFMMYLDPFTSYQCEHFQVFCDIMDNNFATIT
jgi:hypothetical protein